MRSKRLVLILRRALSVQISAQAAAQEADSRLELMRKEQE